MAFSENGLFSGTESDDRVDVEGFTPRPKDDQSSRFDEVGPGYFATLGIPLLLGRGIETQDTANSMRVCVINETFAKIYFGGRNPIGKRVTDIAGDRRIDLRVVGVAKDARDHSLRAKIRPRFYTAVDHGIEGIPPSVYFELRTAGDAEQLLKAARKAVSDINEDLPVVQARTLEQALEQANAPTRLIARLCAIFGAIALLLAATGLYGVLSYGVARRTNEIGIRMALGRERERDRDDSAGDERHDRDRHGGWHRSGGGEHAVGGGAVIRSNGDGPADGRRGRGIADSGGAVGGLYSGGAGGAGQSDCGATA